MSLFTAQSMYDLSGLVAVVTGGGTGIGLMAAQGLAANGAKVYITGRRLNVLDQAAKAHGVGLKGSILPLQGDVSSKQDLVRVAKELEEREGKIHILVNNAGIEGPVTKFKEAEKLTASQLADMHLNNESFEDWDNVLRMDTSSIFFASMAFLNLLEKGNGARKGWTSTIINITSISGIIKNSQYHYAYNSSKAAANHLTKMLAYELNFRARLRLRVNAIAPGLFATEMTASKPSEAGKSELDFSKWDIPAERVGEDEDMASAILFLAANQYTTGQVLAVDGGYTTGTPSVA